MSKKIVKTDKAAAPVGPYNQAVMAGDTLYVSGQIALDAQSGELYKGDLQEETRRVMENLKAVVEAAGLGMEQVIKCSIFIKDMSQFSVINEVYGAYFENDIAPARETVAVVELPKGANVEVSCIAYKKAVVS